MTKKILCVDDETRLLNGIRRRLSHQFELTTAAGGREALAVLESEGPFAVICSDMRMPEMCGTDLLEKVKQVAPHTVRIMLTGNSDQRTAIDAVNQGEIFRFLTKPCSHDVLSQVFELALRQHELLMAEKVLLSETLGGAVGLMGEMLAASKPLSHGRATRIAPRVDALCHAMNIPDAWRVHLAALLSQIGCVTVPDVVLNKVYSGGALTDEERLLYAGHPRRGFELVNKVPRMHEVASLIAFQDHRYRSRTDDSEPFGDELPIGSRILKVALDFDMYSSECGTKEAFRRLSQDAESYDPGVLRALGELLCADAGRMELANVMIYDLREQMVLAENIVSRIGDVLVARGSELTKIVIERLQNYVSAESGVCEPIAVFLPQDQGVVDLIDELQS